MAAPIDKDVDFKHNLKVYYNILKKYKFMVIALAILVSLIEASNLTVKFLLKELIDHGTEFTNGNILAEAFISILVILTLIYLGITIFQVIGYWIKVHFLIKLEASLVKDTNIKFFNHIIHLSHKFHTNHKTGSLISAQLRGTRALVSLTDFFVFNLSPLILQVILVGGSLIYFDLSSAITIFCFIIVFCIYSFIILNKQKKYNILANKAVDYEKANLADIFTNIETVKYFGKEKKVKSFFAKIVKATAQAKTKQWHYYRWFDAGHALILAIGFFFLMYFPTIKFINGDMTIGTLVFIYAVYGQIVGPLFNFVHGVRNFYHAMADFDELFKYDKVKNDIEDKKNAPNLRVKHGNIEFKDITFAYSKRKILKDFNLKIKPGERIALVGHSGCGKTTLMKLLYRLYDTDQGQILVDGKNIKEFKQESLRSELSIVPQECILFDDTIFNNILFSRASAKKDEVLKAIKFAQLDRIIKTFPEKEKTIVGERGIKLSGGEKQRVSIARAILANKKIIVLDEATSSLDSETEYEIQRSLEKLLKNRTSIIIAHRLSTIMNADRIIVMDKGKIVQIGDHNTLIKKQGQYKKLWNLQKGGYIK